MTESIKTPQTGELNQASQYLTWYESDGGEQKLRAAQVYALVAIATELQNIAHKISGIDIEPQNLRGRTP